MVGGAWEASGGLLGLGEGARRVADDAWVVVGGLVGLGERARWGKRRGSIPDRFSAFKKMYC